MGLRGVVRRGAWVVTIATDAAAARPADRVAADLPDPAASTVGRRLHLRRHVARGRLRGLRDRRVRGSHGGSPRRWRPTLCSMPSSRQSRIAAAAALHRSAAGDSYDNALPNRSSASSRRRSFNERELRRRSNNEPEDNPSNHSEHRVTCWRISQLCCSRACENPGSYYSPDPESAHSSCPPALSTP
jgi:hypothetical protein